jgi:hypothetical protein
MLQAKTKNLIGENMDEIIDTFDQFNKARLKPNHEVSQWYMHIEDLRKQVEYLAQNITQEKNCFSR